MEMVAGVVLIGESGMDTVADARYSHGVKSPQR